MGDSTVESLRARLLAERSISRDARKRVEEVEEQLRIANICRKKAEKATLKVLSILESQKASDGSAMEEDESSMERSEVDDGLELEASITSPDTSLSWKGKSKSKSKSKIHIDAENIDQNKRTREWRQRRSLNCSSQSCSKLNFGKSCRKLKPRESKMVDEQETHTTILNTRNGSKEGTCYADQDEAKSANNHTNNLLLDDDLESKEAQLAPHLQPGEKSQRECEEPSNHSNKDCMRCGNKINSACEHKPVDLEESRNRSGSVRMNLESNLGSSLKFYEGRSSEVPRHQQASQTCNSGLGVLETLQRAKLLLKQQLNMSDNRRRISLVNYGHPSIVIKPGNNMTIPPSYISQLYFQRE